MLGIIFQLVARVLLDGCYAVPGGRYIAVALARVFLEGFSMIPGGY